MRVGREGLHPSALSRVITVAIAETFAHEKGEPDKLIVGHFRWDDDFAAARNYADSLTTGGDWHCWIDLD